MKNVMVIMLFAVVVSVPIGLFFGTLGGVEIPDKKQIICIGGYKFLNGSLCGPVQVLNEDGGGVRCDP